MVRCLGLFLYALDIFRSIAGMLLKIIFAHKKTNH